MFVVEDYTQLALGVQVPTDGLIASCPRCGRKGARRERFDGSVRYVHVQTSLTLGDGARTEPSDSCTVAAAGDGRAPATIPPVPRVAPPAPGS
jgi:hypothetical protein